MPICIDGCIYEPDWATPAPKCRRICHIPIAVKFKYLTLYAHNGCVFAMEDDTLSDSVLLEDCQSFESIHPEKKPAVHIPDIMDCI